MAVKTKYKGSKRLIQIGLASLYNRKIQNSVRYIYRKVGRGKGTQPSFRWQPQFHPNNQTDDEYMKKRTFSWITKRRSDMGELPESTTKDNWTKSHRENSDWRASHYFWSWKRNEAELRMDAETEDPDETINRFAKFYQKYVEQLNLPKWSKLAMADLLNKIKMSGRGKINERKFKTIIRSSDGAAARSKEEKLIYLAPHLNKAVSKGLISSTPEEKEIEKIVSRLKFTASRPQQLDIKSGTVESKMIEAYIKSKENEIMTRAADKSAFVRNMGAGTEVTMKRMFHRWKEATRNINLNKHKKLNKVGRYKELMSVVSTMESDINSSKPDVELRGEAKRRFAKEAKKDKMYTYTIPTEAGDLVIVKVKQEKDGITLTGGVIPDVKSDMGTAATDHMLGAATTRVTKKVLDKLDNKNSFKYNNAINEFTETEAERLLWMRNKGNSVTENVYAPTYSVNVMSEGGMARDLSKLVDEAFGAYYNQGTWQNAFDPTSQYSDNNAFRKWARDWIAKTISLTKELSKLADGDTNWKSWMQNKVKAGVNPWTWSEPVHIRPFVFSSKRGQFAKQASMMTAQGHFLDYKEALMRM